MDLLVEMRDDILIAKASGSLSFDDALSLLKTVMDHAAEYKAHKVVIDCVEVRGWLSTFERYNLGTDVFRHMQLLGINPRVALVGTRPEVDGFGVQVANNRGAEGAVFDELAPAMEWLGKP